MQESIVATTNDEAMRRTSSFEVPWLRLLLLVVYLGDQVLLCGRFLWLVNGNHQRSWITLT